MNLPNQIARRYLWMSRKQRHTAFLSTISIFGLATGVATLLISLALLSGLQGQIKQRLIASSPQLLIEPVHGNTLDDSAAIVDAARKLGMTNIQPIVSGIGWGANADDKRGRPMRIRSYLGATHGEAQPGIQLTRDFSASIGLNTGDSITVVAPRTRLTPFGSAPVWRRYRIEKLLPSTGDEHGADGQLDLAETESFFGTAGRPTSIEIYGNTDLADAIQPKLARRFPDVQVKTWKEINRPLFLTLRLEKTVMFAAISLIIFVAALNLISSLSMLIMEKRPQVGILRTLGATERNVLSIFLQVGLLIGLGGTVLGNIIGIGVAWSADHFHLIRLPSDVYFVNYLPFSLDAADIAGVNALAVLLSVIATWYPARIASRLDPIVAIREE